MARLTTLFPFLLLAFFSVSSASGRDSLDASGVSSERFCFSSAQTHQTLRSALHANRAALLPASPAQRRAPSLSPRSRSCSLPFKIRAGWSQRASLPGALRMMAGGEELVSGASAVDGALKADFSRAQKIGEALGRAMAAKSLGEDGAGVLKALLSTRDGARGFYVSTLTMPGVDSMFSETIDARLIDAIAQNSDSNASLLAMNLAMSTACEVTHLAMGNPVFAQGSKLTQGRTKRLISAVLSSSPPLQEELAQLQAALEGREESGGYPAFLERWGYGQAEKAAILREVQGAVADLR
mmetsp:Transcript_45091/g.107542  ORF Transcript_45091/g.107542 Transcript_45091/m.107542 type:complete len:297 (-) Transcript_45091:110-1000(-)